MSRSSANTARGIVVGFLALMIVAGGLAGAVHAELAGPGSRERKVTKAVAALLTRAHLSRRPLDDQVSERCMKSFLRALDPMKVYFTQQDIDRLMAWNHELDDLAADGNVEFAYDAYNLFVQRVRERVALVDQLLEMDHDFTVDESIIVDRDATTYAHDDAEMFEKWRKRIKYDLLREKAEETEPDKAREKLHRRYHSFARRMEQTDDDELLEMFLSSLTTAFDPHTTYMSPSTLENFRISMQLELEGIGAQLQSEDGMTIVRKIIPGGAADKDGNLKPEDHIVGVGQGPDGEIVDVVDMKLSDVVEMIRGKRGTIVRLKVVSGDDAPPEVYNIERARIELKDSEARAAITTRGRKPNGEPYKIGVINLPSFYMDMDAARLQLPNYKSTTRDVERILNDFRSEGVDMVLMDLRENGGGSLTEAIHLTGLFIDEGPVVQVKGPDEEVQTYDDLDRGTAWNGPLVVLVSKFSASASEIFAGAIQDYGRGVIVGDHATHGKGTVQTLRELGRELFVGPNRMSLGALKITMQQFYRPKGDSTQKRGVVADVELPSLITHLDIAESDLDYAVEFDRVEPAPFKSVGMIDRAIIGELNRRSAARRQGSEDFQKLEANIASYLERKNRKQVSLNEAKFLAEREKLDTEKTEEDTFERLANQDDEVIPDDYYFTEAMEVSLDYLELLTKLARAN